MTDITDRDRLDFLAANTEFKPGGHNETEGESLSHWSLRTAAIFTAPKSYAPADLRSAIDRAIEVENILETRRRKQEGVIQEIAGLPAFRLTPPPGVDYKTWIRTFSIFLATLQARVWAHTQDGRPDTLVIAPDLWPIVDAQDGYAEELQPSCQNLHVRRVGNLTHHGLTVVVSAGLTGGTGNLSCSNHAGPDYQCDFQTYAEEDL